MPSLTPRELVLAATLLVTMLLNLASFLLQGRVGIRTHVALALLSVLAGGFGLLVLFGGALYAKGAAGAIGLLLLVLLFRLMSQFEAGPK